MTLVSGARATQNKHLSDDMSALLKLGGVSWLLRQAILLATISLHTVQTKTETERNTSTTSTTTSTGTSTSSNSTITIQNVANGGLKGTTEIRHLDWEWREHRDYVWGKVRGRCGFKPTQDVADERLRVGWLDETLLGECIQEDVVAVDDSWHSTMVRFFFLFFFFGPMAFQMLVALLPLDSFYIFIQLPEVGQRGVNFR